LSHLSGAHNVCRYLPRRVLWHLSPSPHAEVPSRRRLGLTTAGATPHGSGVGAGSGFE
jgi:hypothetical protein